ncbi:MAG: heme-copper oxidase subunit III [Candidatus Heimdallarchaeota archaeon]|nr:MAG: heme-copper oxidase subunit III [Candidatus Heimdallarchaeota archaeon]
MAELHPIVLHFHIALLAFSIITSVIACILSILGRLDIFNRKFLSRIFKEKISVTPDTFVIYTDKFEFVAFISLIFGLLSLFPAMLTGFLDASGKFGLDHISIETLLLGIENAGRSEFISFKVIWATVGTSFFIYACILRVYFVNYRKERLYGQNILFQLVYLSSQIIGYLIFVIVAGAGAILVYGGTLISDIPILEAFLPQGEADPIIIVLIASLIILLLTVIGGFLRKPNELTTVPEEHEITFWPPILAIGTGILAWGLLLIAQEDFLSGLAFLWIFVVLLIAFLFKETYSEKITKPKETWIWLFLASEVIIFIMVIGTSFAFRIASAASWPVPSSILNVPLTAINTFILIVSSFTLVKAVEGIQNGNQKRLRNFLLLTFLFGSIFLSIQVIEYLSLFHEGFTPSTSLFGSTFYIQTGLHGAHVFFGILLVLFMTLKAFQGGFTQENHGAVELVGIYWHFVDLVWIILFTLVYLI